MLPEESAALDQYLSAPQWTDHGDGLRSCAESSFSAALRDARGATGRGPDGKVVEPERSASWLGAMGYLAFLDQVGTAVRSVDFQRPAGDRQPALRRALAQFAPSWVTEEHGLVLWALRNSLAHDYSLFSQHRDRSGQLVVDSSRHFAFSFDVEGDELIQRAEAQWSGVLHPDELPIECRTVVSLRQLGDLAERVRARVVEEHACGRLRIALDGGADEMNVRYRFRFFTRE